MFSTYKQNQDVASELKFRAQRYNCCKLMPVNKKGVCKTIICTSKCRNRSPCGYK